jgi:hypothetical protein
MNVGTLVHQGLDDRDVPFLRSVKQRRGAFVGLDVDARAVVQEELHGRSASFMCGVVKRCVTVFGLAWTSTPSARSISTIALWPASAELWSAVFPCLVLRVK